MFREAFAFIPLCSALNDHLINSVIVLYYSRPKDLILLPYHFKHLADAVLLSRSVYLKHILRHETSVLLMEGDEVCLCLGSWEYVFNSLWLHLAGFRTSLDKVFVELGNIG